MLNNKQSLLIHHLWWPIRWQWHKFDTHECADPYSTITENNWFEKRFLHVYVADRQRLKTNASPFSQFSWKTTELQISCAFAFFTLRKRVKTHVLSDQSVHITHAYCCVSKLSKFGAYLYSRVHNNTFLSLRNSL
jgi:hypothetical protein